MNQKNQSYFLKIFINCGIIAIIDNRANPVQIIKHSDRHKAIL